MKTVEDYMRLPYTAEITPDVDEGGYVVSYPDLPGCLSSGSTVEKALKNAEDAKKIWLAAAIEDGVVIQEPEEMMKYSGQFKLRLPKRLYQTLARNAKREGISMNQYCVYLLSRQNVMYVSE